MSTHRCCPHGSNEIAAYGAGSTDADHRADRTAREWGGGAHVHYDAGSDSFTVVVARASRVLVAYGEPAHLAAFGR
jgi:hypothetical protein